MADQCIIFIHVPKTGGATLRRVFHREYGDNVLSLATLDQPLAQVAQVPYEARAAAKLVLGHVHYGIHEYIPKECSYVTVLRDPVERILSLYKFIARERNHPLYERFGNFSGSLDEYVSTDADRNQVDNGQTRQIAGTPIDLDRVGAADLERAKSNLESFLVIGLTERFDESFVLMRKTLGWPLSWYKTENTSPRVKLQLPDETIRVIRERNRYDIELYDFAAQLLSKAVAEQPASFRTEVAAFQTMNWVPATWGRTTSRLRSTAARSPILRWVYKRLR